MPDSNIGRGAEYSASLFVVFFRFSWEIRDSALNQVVSPSSHIL
jgi:hypothetical protein